MVHVALIQGNCDPLGSQSNVTAYLGNYSSADLPSLSGTLTCGGEGGELEICDDGIDNDGDGKTDCLDKKDCNKDPAC